jgi:hypothetical protein
VLSPTSTIRRTGEKGAYDTQKLITIPCLTYGYWYQRFSVGLYKRMGDVVKLDYAVTLDIVTELLEQLNSVGEVATGDRERKRIRDICL